MLGRACDPAAVGSSIVGLAGPTTSLVLTYDDGPTPAVTDRLLPILSEYGATATFFVLLTRVRRYPTLIHEVIAEGHEVALHGGDHQRLTGLGARVTRQLLRDSRSELEDVVGLPVKWFRPAYGAQDRNLWRAARSAELTPVLWTLDCRDWLPLSINEHLSYFQGAALPGAVVLLHDGFANAGDGASDGPEPAVDRIAIARGLLDEASRSRTSVQALSHALSHTEPCLRVWLDAANKRMHRHLAGEGLR